MIYMWFTGINYYKLAVALFYERLWPYFTTVWKPNRLNIRNPTQDKTDCIMQGIKGNLGIKGRMVHAFTNYLKCLTFSSPRVKTKIVNKSVQCLSL